jgi:hypothetical protein
MNKALCAIAAAVLCSTAVPARASEWGCQVLLCLANPAGPMAAAACVPPITRLWNALRKPKPDPFPTCEEAGNSFAKQGYSLYDSCPAGTKALAAGTSAIQMTSSAYNELAKSNPMYFGRDLSPATAAALKNAKPAAGIGEGEGSHSLELGMPHKVCVGGEMGTVVLAGPTFEDGFIQATAFKQVVTLPPHGSGSYIDVFVDGKLQTRVRY